MKLAKSWQKPGDRIPGRGSTCKLPCNPIHCGKCSACKSRKKAFKFSNINERNMHGETALFIAKIQKALSNYSPEAEDGAQKVIDLLLKHGATD